MGRVPGKVVEFDEEDPGKNFLVVSEDGQDFSGATYGRYVRSTGPDSVVYGRYGEYTVTEDEQLTGDQINRHPVLRRVYRYVDGAAS